MQRRMILLKADPAVLEFTLGAGHMVTAIKFIARYATLGTELAVVTFLPLDELFIRRTALRSRMGHFATLEANICAAFALHYFLPPASLLHVVHAAGSRAPL